MDKIQSLPNHIHMPYTYTFINKSTEESPFSRSTTKRKHMTHVPQVIEATVLFLLSWE